MIDLLTNEWALLSTAILAASMNFYYIRAENSYVKMRTLFLDYETYIQFINWILLTACIIFLCFNYSWFYLLSGGAFMILGKIITSIWGAFIQITYIFLMPILVAALILTHI